MGGPTLAPRGPLVSCARYDTRGKLAGVHWTAPWTVHADRPFDRLLDRPGARPVDRPLGPALDP